MKSANVCGGGRLPEETVSKQQAPVRTHPTHNLGIPRVVTGKNRPRFKSMSWPSRTNFSKGTSTCSFRPLIGLTFLALFQILLWLPQVEGGCREEPRAACEAICEQDPYTDWTLNCTLRAVVILPASTVYEASLPKVLPVLELAEKRVKELQILPRHFNFKWIPYDDKCDASYATISAMDGYGKDCAHVLFGPACDYALASVGRIAKYFRSEGTPLLSVGGFSFNFQHKKRSCVDEFYMLIRTGMLGFQAIAELFVAMMKRYNWTQAVFFYDRDGQKNVAGLHTCHLMMNTLANFYRDAGIIYSSFVTDSGTGNLTEDLTREVGLDHSSKFQSIASVQGGKMFHLQDISGGIHNRKLVKVTPLEPVKVEEITFPPRSCTFTKIMAKYLDRIKNFTVREDDVWLISIPKSGTTWTQEMCWLIINNFNFEMAKSVDIGTRCPCFELTGIGTDAIDSFENAEKLDSPRFLQSHLPLPFLPRELWTKNPKILYVARDPRDVVVSRYIFSKHWYKLTVSKNDFYKAFINDEVHFTPYFDHVLEFWKIRNHPNILFLTYEEMILDLKAVILKTCNFFNQIISSDHLENLLEHLSFDSMKKNKACWREYQRKLLSNVEPGANYRFIRRGIAGSYKDELPKELLDSYSEWMRNNLKDTDCDIFKI